MIDWSIPDPTAEPSREDNDTDTKHSHETTRKLLWPYSVDLDLDDTSVLHINPSGKGMTEMTQLLVMLLTVSLDLLEGEEYDENAEYKEEEEEEQEGASCYDGYGDLTEDDLTNAEYVRNNDPWGRIWPTSSEFGMRSRLRSAQRSVHDDRVLAPWGKQSGR